jgi:hypothetical protein
VAGETRSRSPTSALRGGDISRHHRNVSRPSSKTENADLVTNRRSTPVTFHHLAASKCNRFGGSRLCAKTPIGPLMHAARLGGKRRKRVWAAAEPHSDALRFAQVTKQQSALLALVGQAMTLSASKHFAAEVKHCHPPAAIATVDVRSADKPWTLATKMAGAPSNGHTLFGILHLAQEMTRAVTQYQCVPFCAHVDAARVDGAA